MALFLESDNLWTLDTSPSTLFEEVELTVLREVELTEKLVQKVLETWVERNLANQELVRGLQKFYLNGKKTNKTPFYQSLEDQEPNAERFNKAFARLKEAIASWEFYKVKGFEVTIIK